MNKKRVQKVITKFANIDAEVKLELVKGNTSSIQFAEDNIRTKAVCFAAVHGMIETSDIAKIQSIASSLFDGGWRSSDREQIQAEYELTDDETDSICQELEAMEDNQEE